MAPGQSCSTLLQHFARALSRPGTGELPHIPQISDRQALHIGELAAQVGRQALNDPRAPALLILSAEDAGSNLPVSREDYGAYGKGGLRARRTNRVLNLRQDLG
jgi:hypothetical protein